MGLKRAGNAAQPRRQLLLRGRRRQDLDEGGEGITQRPAVLRIDEALALAGVTHFVVACPKDLGMFEDAVKTVGAESRLRVVDLGELVFEAMGLAAEASTASCGDRHHDRTG